MPRWARILLGVLLAIMVLVGGAILVLTNTSWGRHRIAGYVLAQLRGSVHGKVGIGTVKGNLLTGARIANVEITDSTGDPFLRADTVVLHYSIGRLIHRRLDFHDVRLVNPIVVLNQPPGGTWNFKRIFPGQPNAGPAGAGFGSWIQLANTTVRGGLFVVKAAWAPADSLGAAARRKAIQASLSPDSRQWVVRDDGGYQSIYEFFGIAGHLPFMRLADPDSVNRVIDMDSLQMIALPFRPPAARVRQLAAHFVITRDTLFFQDVKVALPSTAFAGSGAYALDGSGVHVHGTAPVIAFHDLHFLDPALPPGGGSVSGGIMRQRQGHTRFSADRLALHAEGARVRGHGAVQLGDTVRIGPTDLAFTGVTTSLLERFTPLGPLPVHGSLAGHVAVAGAPASLALDGWARFDPLRGAPSKVFAKGGIDTGGAGGLRMRDLALRFAPLQLALARELAPSLPPALNGTLTGTATLTGSTRTRLSVRADLVDHDPTAGASHVLADGGIQLAGGLDLRALRLRFSPLRLAFAHQLAPSLPASLNGTVTGTATLSGRPTERLSLTADLVDHDRDAGRSHVRARGAVQIGGGFRAEGLHLEFLPLQVAAVKPFAPSLPITGTLSGTAAVTGAPATRLATAVDLVHEGRAGRSHVIGTADVNPGTPSRFDVDLRAPELALGTVGRFVPSAGLHGSAHGDIAAHGSFAHVTLAANLAVTGGGAVAAHGTLALRGTPKAYDLSARFDRFDAGAASTRAPRTRLNGTASAVGHGTTLATMNATVRADLVDLAVKGQQLDTTRLLVGLNDGLATFQRGHVRMNTVAADVNGSFGLVAARSGTLRYDVQLDSLGAFRSAIPSDTTAFPPRPLLQERAIARARADSTRLARATEVQRLAVGYPPAPALHIDTVPPLPVDSVAGSVRAVGTLTGNVHRFSTRGSATADHVVAAGNAIAHAAATYTLEDYGTPSPTVRVTAAADTLRTAGFVFDSAYARVAYTGKIREGNGSADVELYQGTTVDYRLSSEFTLALDRNHVRLNRLALRFDTVTWRSTRPGIVDWSGAGIAVDSLSLASSQGGRFMLNGRVPVNGPADLRLDVDSLGIGQLAALLQDTARVTGLLSLHARLVGPRAAPRFSGTASLLHGGWGTITVPRLNAGFAYAGTELTAHATLLRADTTAATPVAPLVAGRTPQAGAVAGPALAPPVPADTLASIDARLPIDLSLTSVKGSRLLARPLSVALTADSFPASLLSRLTTAVTNVQGRLAGNVDVTGTWKAPVTRGLVKLDLGSLDVPSIGVGLRQVTGAVQLRGDSAHVDSLVARSAGGTVRAAGAIGLSELSNPALDLTGHATNAVILDNQYGRITADADMKLSGHYRAARVTGTAHVTSGVMYAPEPTNRRRITNLENPALAQALDTASLTPDILPPPNPFLQNMTVDVGVTIARNTWVRNTNGNVEIYTAPEVQALRIHMDRAQQTLTLRGVVNADRGEYSFAGRLFRLNTGAVTFLGRPEVDPMLQLNGEYDVPRQDRETLVIQIHVLGTMRQPAVSLESNSQPPLSQSDLISYLAFGRTSSSLLNLQGTNLTGGAGGLDGLPALAEQQLAGLALGSFMDSEISSIERSGTRGGLDVLRIHPASLPAELTFNGYFQNFLRGTEIEAGKYMSRRLYVAIQDRISGNWPGFRVEYRTPGNFSWETTWQPTYLPSVPSLTLQPPTRDRTFGTFLFWTRRF